MYFLPIFAIGCVTGTPRPLAELSLRRTNTSDPSCPSVCYKIIYLPPPPAQRGLLDEEIFALIQPDASML
jgi:hypothetical protein